MLVDSVIYEGSCLCGHIKFSIEAEPSFPHLCSCNTCKKWSGAPAVSWVDFPLSTVTWTESDNIPQAYRVSETAQRGNCPKCGSCLCVITDDSNMISIAVSSLDQPEITFPAAQPSHPSGTPHWWQTEVRSA